MLYEELIDLANATMKQKAEGQTLEVKAAHVDCPKRLYDTLSSFSNPREEMRLFKLLRMNFR